MVYAQTRIRPGEWDRITWDFVIQTDHLIPVRRLNVVIVKKKKKEEKREPTE